MTAIPYGVTQGTADAEPLRWTDDGWALEIEWPAREVPLDEIMRLAATGAPLTSAEVPPWVPPELGALLADRSWLDHRPDGTRRCVAALRRQEHGVRLRRLALRRADRPSVSVVMSSKRPHLVGFALAQMARQRHVEVEVVLGLHGVPLEEVRQAVASCPLPLTCVEADADVPFGEVLNRAAARASGAYLTKWDDDDWYGPEHLSDLLLAVADTGADIVGTTAEFFYLEPLDVTIRRTTFASGAAYPSEVWADHVAGGTILLATDAFHRLGGFAAEPRAVDRLFLKAARQAGAGVYRTHGLGYVLRRTLGDEHTWQLPLAHFLRVASSQWRGFRPSQLLEAA
ncbi:glycosyltransferase [Nonomuraea sp. NPDC050556]|uniref:glycosyltransferase n=1 Tax=Nonomuraea sp. NPDC050556 TaxID=3364369 RepID=UPI0037B27C68